MMKYMKCIVMVLIANTSVLYGAASSGLPAAANAVAGASEVKRTAASDPAAIEEMWDALGVGSIKRLRKVLASGTVGNINVPSESLISRGIPTLPLYYALKYQSHHPLLALALLEYGADPALPAQQPTQPQHPLALPTPFDPNYTMVHLAAEMAYSLDDARRLFNALLSRNSTLVDLQDADGRTPIMIAAETDNMPNVRALLENGASIYFKDNEGNDLFFYARNNPALVAFLTNYRETRKKALSEATHGVLPPDIENLIVEKS